MREANFLVQSRPCLRRLGNIVITGAVIALMRMEATAQTLTTLHSFDGSDGQHPLGELVQGNDGNFYGTTYDGGPYSAGTVFRIDPNGSLTNLHSFNGSDGDRVLGALVQGSDGYFYGTTLLGGIYGAGTIFVMGPDGSFATLHSFSGEDGSYAFAGLVEGTDGNFYGTTELGGTNCVENGGCGTAFRMSRDGSLTTLYHFGGSDPPCNGQWPRGELTQGTDGNFYGTTYGGPYGDGSVFMLTPGGDLTGLHCFLCNVPPGDDGAQPQAGLVQGRDGEFYGMTQYCGTGGFGTVFRISSSGSFTLLHSLIPYFDTGGPIGGLLQSRDGNFYGTATEGGTSHRGVIFKITPNGALTILHSFDGSDGRQPQSGLVQGSDGNFYGTARWGGTNACDCGTVFKFEYCGFSLSPTQAVFKADGGNGEVSVTPTATNCAWTANAEAGFITITSGSSGIGDGVVSYSVATNNSAARTGTITVAGETFTVTQGRPDICADLTGTWNYYSWRYHGLICKTTSVGLQCKARGRLILRNIGNTNAPTTFIRYYLSSDNQFDPGDTLLKQQATGKINPGKSRKRTLSAMLPVGIDGSGQFLVAVIDADNAIGECDKDNNIIVAGPLP